MTEFFEREKFGGRWSYRGAAGLHEAATLVLAVSTMLSIIAALWPGTATHGVYASRESRPASRNDALRAAVEQIGSWSTW